LSGGKGLKPLVWGWARGLSPLSGGKGLKPLVWGWARGLSPLSGAGQGA